MYLSFVFVWLFTVALAYKENSANILFLTEFRSGIPHRTRQKRKDQNSTIGSKTLFNIIHFF